MELIKPSEISGKVMSLIEDAEKFIFIVSPYYNISNWHKLLKKINEAKQRGIQITFCVRKPENYKEEKNVIEIRNLGYEPVQIERLHAKLYFNENEAIITSMNLMEVSDIGSIDIGLKTETKEEFEGIKTFYKRYINAKKETSNPLVDFDYFLKTIKEQSAKIFKRDPYIEFEGNSITIKGNNIYTVFIANEYKKGNSLRMSCILSEKEFELFQIGFIGIASKKYSIRLQAGKKGYYSLIWATTPNIVSSSLDEITNGEGKMIIETILDFIKNLEEIKQDVRYL